MARKFETGIIITGDGKGGVRAIKANREELDRFDRQSRQTRGSTERLSASWGEARRMAVSFAGAVGLSTAGFAAMVARQANAARENAALADSLGVSTQRLQEWQYAGMSVGVEADKVGDIFKDVSDKLGDFVRTGGGEAADLFEQLNLNTSELIQMSPDQQLLAIGQALSQLTNQGEKVFFLESIADDASRLMPLLENNAAGLKAAAQEARDFGYALDENQNRALVDAGNGLTRLTGFAEGFANRLTIAVAPAISRTTDNLDELNTIVSDPAFQSALNDLANIGAKMAQGLAKGSLQFLQQIGSIDDKLRVWASDQFGIGDDFSVDLSRSNALRTEIDYLQTLANGNWFDRIGNGYASLEAVNEKLAEKQAELATVNGNVFDSFGALVAGIGDASGAVRNHAAATDEDSAAMDVLAGALKPLLTAYDADHTKRQQLIADRQTLTDALDKEPEKAEAIRRAIAEIDDQLKKLNGTQKQTQSEAQKAAEQLQQRYESTRASMAQQIALMGQVGQAAQVRYDAEFGELRKLSAERKKALIDQATELDMLQRKQDLLDSFVQSSSLSGLFDQRDQAQKIGGATGRIAERNVGKAITDQAREGAPQVQGLDAQYSGPFGEADRIESERTQLQAWYAERIAMYEDFKQLEADKADEYNAVITGLERDRASQMLSIDHQVQQARLAGYSTLFGDLADLSKTFAGEQSGIYQTLFAAEKSYSIASTLASSYTAIAKAWASAPFPANLPAVASATIETGALNAAVQGLSLAGQAHDGIDNIPADGTWNLQKNERVVDRRTNADLKQYLDRANAANQNHYYGGKGGDVTVQMSVNVQAQPGMSEADARRQGKAIGDQAEAQMRQFIIKEKRPGGLLAS